MLVEPLSSLRALLPPIALGIAILSGATGALASPAACARLVSGSVKASDVQAAYSFVRNHSACLAKFEDSSFQAVAAALTAARAAKVIDANSCAAALTKTSSPVIQSLINQVGAGVAASHLECGCAVADSGVAEKLRDIVADIKSCGEGFNPVDWSNDGLKLAAGGFSGLGDALGIGGGPAEGPNGGAPTYNYICPAVGAWMTAGQRSPVGWCGCPANTTQEWGNLANGGDIGSSRCVSACAKTDVYRNGSCQPCVSGGLTAGGVSYQSYPDATGTQCLTQGSGYAVSCKPGQIRAPDQHSCLAACPFNAIADPRTNSCAACPAGTRPRYFALGSSLGQCEPTRPDPAKAIGGNGVIRRLPGATAPSRPRIHRRPRPL